MSLKLTGTERSWILYDVGNSAFTLMLSTIIPIYFNSIAGEDLSSVDYLAYWGYAASIATDAGCGSIAQKLQFGGKIVIFLMSISVVTALVDVVSGLMDVM